MSNLIALLDEIDVFGQIKRVSFATDKTSEKSHV